MNWGRHHRYGRVAKYAVAVLFLVTVTAKAEDGYRLWLRYDPLPQPTAEKLRSRFSTLIVPGNSATANATRSELTDALTGLLGSAPRIASKIEHSGALVVGTPESTSLIASLGLQRQLAELGPEGFVIRTVWMNSQPVTVIASQSETGALYGSFHFLRLMQTIQSVESLNVALKPRLRLRVLDHWDNLDGSIERGYAGRSLWDWSALPQKVDHRIPAYPP